MRNVLPPPALPGSGLPSNRRTVPLSRLWSAPDRQMIDSSLKPSSMEIYQNSKKDLSSAVFFGFVRLSRGEQFAFGHLSVVSD